MAFGEAAFAEWAAGQAMTLEQAVPAALAAGDLDRRRNAAWTSVSWKPEAAYRWRDR